MQLRSICSGGVGDGWKEERTVISGWQKDHRHEQEDEWEKKTSLIYNVKGRGIHSATERESGGTGGALGQQ